MRLTQIRDFVAVVDAGSISAAAANARVTGDTSTAAC